MSIYKEFATIACTLFAEDKYNYGFCEIMLGIFTIFFIWLELKRYIEPKSALKIKWVLFKIVIDPTTTLKN